MRYFGNRYVVPIIPEPPDTIQAILLAANTGQAMDWAGAATAAAASAHLVRLTGISTAGLSMNFYASLETTRAAIPTSGQSTVGTSFPMPILGQSSYQIPGGSTGFSVIAPSSGWVIVEMWKKSG